MFDWNAVRIALTFLENEEDKICLQIQDPNDLQYFQSCIRKMLNQITTKCMECSEYIITDIGTVFFESCSSGLAGYTHECPHFTIDRTTYMGVVDEINARGRKAS